MTYDLNMIKFLGYGFLSIGICYHTTALIEHLPSIIGSVGVTLGAVLLSFEAKK